VEEFKYFGTNLTNQNSIQEEIKSSLKWEWLFNSVQNLLSSRLLSKNLKTEIYRTIILPVVVYECETCSLKLRKERRFEFFENRVLRRIFGPRRVKVTEEWIQLHHEEWAEHVARLGENRGVYGTLVGEPEGKRPLGKPRRRWEDNIKMDIQEVGYVVTD